jgi:hypothetical protein
MARIFEITQSIRDLATAAFSDLLDQLGKPCKLFYPPRMKACSNCIADPIGHKSTNRWLRGGPVEFPFGSICPLCGGQGAIAEEVSETVNLLVTQDVTKFEKIGISNVNLPDGIIQTKGYLSDLSKILKCDYIIVNTNIQNIITQRYKLFSEPVSPGNISQNVFFICLWQRDS